VISVQTVVEGEAIADEEEIPSVAIVDDVVEDEAEPPIEKKIEPTTQVEDKGPKLKFASIDTVQQYNDIESQK